MTKIIPTPLKDRTEPYWKELNKVIDPEMGLGLVDIGLIYNVDIDDEGTANIKMTLTSPGCPVGPQLIKQVEDRMRNFADVKKVDLEVVWEPHWTQDMIDPDIRDLLFGF